MSSPMHDVPNHFPIGVNAELEGPLDFDDPTVAGVICWCGDLTCLHPSFLNNKEMVHQSYKFLR